MISRLLDLMWGYRNPLTWWKNIGWRFPATVSDMNVVFVVGAPRSGTTLMQCLLSVHSRLFSIQSETGMFTRQNIFDLDRKHFGLPDERVKRLFAESVDIVDFFQRSAGLLATQYGGRTFVEKTPQHVRNLPFIFRHFPNARVIHIVRDGRDCFCSAKHHPGIPQNADIVEFAGYWRDCVQTALPFLQHPHMHTVRYEELVADPVGQMKQVMPFLGLQLEPDQLNPACYGADIRATLSEFAGLQQGVNPSSVNRWSVDLTPEEVVRFETVAADMLSRYGYPVATARTIAMAKTP